MKITDKKLINANIFKAGSYKRASDITANLSSNVEEIYRKEGVEDYYTYHLLERQLLQKLKNILLQEK